MRAPIRSVALQRCDSFVGRTTNWLYDHLRFVDRYTPVVLCETLTNRDEFPVLKARSFNSHKLSRRLWRRLTHLDIYPSDLLWIKRLKPVILHSHFGYVATEDLQLIRRLGLPWIVSFYGADLYQLGIVDGRRDTYAQVFQRATMVLALGPVMAAELANRLSCSEEKIVVHPLGVDVTILPTKPRVKQPKEPLQVLYAGTFREKKGVQYVIRGCALALKAGVSLQLHLVGDAGPKPGDRETKDAILREIQDLNISHVVRLYSFLSFRELLRVALDAHVFVAPSVTALDGDAEGTPFVLQQMMGTAMPAVATLHSDIPFLFGEHAHLLVPERDAEAIAARLTFYARHPAALVEHGALLREQILRFFEVRASASRLSALYERALATHWETLGGKPAS